MFTFVYFVKFIFAIGLSGLCSQHSCSGKLIGYIW